MSDAERDFTEAKQSLEPIQYPTNNILAVLDTSTAHGARDLGYFGRFVIERLRPHR